MDAGEHHILREVEDDYWWYRVLRWQVLRQVPAGACVLDAGCGTGGLMATLQAAGCDVHGIDISPAAIHHCQQRGLSKVQLSNVHSLPFPDASFDAVISLDVLYHQGVDEELALAEMKRVLKPGGRLILNLPAFACLRGSHDFAVCGVKRYKRCQVQTLLAFHSLHSEMIHYWNAWLFFPILIWRQLSRKITTRNVSDLRLPLRGANGPLFHIGKLDSLLCQTLRIPFGTSLFVVAIKPGHE